MWVQPNLEPAVYKTEINNNTTNNIRAENTYPCRNLFFPLWTIFSPSVPPICLISPRQGWTCGRSTNQNLTLQLETGLIICFSSHSFSSWLCDDSLPLTVPWLSVSLSNLFHCVPATLPLYFLSHSVAIILSPIFNFLSDDVSLHLSLITVLFSHTKCS